MYTYMYLRHVTACHSCSRRSARLASASLRMRPSAPWIFSADSCREFDASGRHAIIERPKVSLTTAISSISFI